jgi:hypothetical protein
MNDGTDNVLYRVVNEDELIEMLCNLEYDNFDDGMVMDIIRHGAKGFANMDEDELLECAELYDIIEQCLEEGYITKEELDDEL